MIKLSPNTLLNFYKHLITPRLIEEKMLLELRKGKISKWFSAWGQEAISVGATLALTSNDYICTVHRNLGVFTSRNIPLHKLFSQFMGKENGFTKGRDRSFHFGTHEHKIIGMISHLAAQMGVADGIALAEKLSVSKEICLVFSGDGGSSEGEFHEAVNVAAVWKLPLIIVIENNQWGLSTPSEEQFSCRFIADKGIGYGIESETIDGNNIIEVYHTVKKWTESIRENPRPVIIECLTFRMRGHEEASGTKYYPQGIQEKWLEKDPIKNFEDYLLSENILTTAKINEIKTEITDHINTDFNYSMEESPIKPSVKKELGDIYAPFKNEKIKPKTLGLFQARFIDAISNALDLGMEKYKQLILMGQDIAEYGGVFKVTENLYQKYGKERVRNTPLCESAIVGTAYGLSLKGYKSMVEMQFGDFVTNGFNQIVNNLGTSYYRWGQQADVVIRMPCGGGAGAGPFHSQTNEAWFTKIPGLKVVYPAFPYDAKGLLLQSFEDTNPIMFFEHKNLYRSLSQEIPKDYYTIPFGKGKRLRKGNDLSIITYGMGVHWVLEFLNTHQDLSIELIDLRTLIPLDKKIIFKSIKKTNRALILHEDSLVNGFGAELAALISENCFEDLDAPIMRVASLNTPIPFSKELENQYFAKNILSEKIFEILNY